MEETIKELEKENNELKNQVDSLLDDLKDRDNTIKAITRNIQDAIYELNRNL